MHEPRLSLQYLRIEPFRSQMSGFFEETCEMRQSVQCCPGNTYLDCKKHGRVKYFLPVYEQYVDVVIDLAHEHDCSLKEAWSLWDIRRRNVPTGDAGSPIPDASERDSTRSSVLREPSVERTTVYEAPNCLPLHSSTMPEQPSTNDEEVRELAIQNSERIRAWVIAASEALPTHQPQKTRAIETRGRGAEALLEAGSDYAFTT